ncbi:MAG: chitobiase/beta-hexosaminidase C-terminal domain-containing protein [Fibrobacteria bacterium]
MPPIYGIFLGKPRTDTSALAELATLTGGKFYLIPPNDPDSLIGVVEKILNIILLEYEPQTATVTNTSLTPTQSATSVPADFIPQIDGSWQMVLSDIIGLRRSNTNAITVTTTFKEKTSGAIDTKTITFNLSTTGAETGTSQKITKTQFDVKCYDKSALAIQKSDGTRPTFFTNQETAYRLRLRTSANPLDSALFPSRTPLKGDAESPVRKPGTGFVDSLVFDGTFPFAVTPGARTNGNGTLESDLYDSILVTWVHPRDAQDFANDFMVVRAPTQSAKVWFSQTNGGPVTNQYQVDAAFAYIVVTDQAADPRRSYSAVVSSEKFGIDRETVTLTEATPGSGILLGKIPISAITKTSADNLLQVSAGGDQLRVVYKDLVDNDSAVATAGFDEIVQEAATLEFTNAAGVALAPGAIWSPVNGKLYFKYSDDYAGGLVANKNIALTLVNRKYGAAIGTDHERIVVAMEAGATGTRATWTGSIDLLDAFPAVDSNGKAETRFRGEAALSAFTHDREGAQQSGTVTDNLVIAYPDSQANITWKLDTTVTPKANEGLVITINDQTFSLNQKDTALVSIACTKSGDSVASFPAVEGTATSGTYISGTMVKDTAVPNYNDKILSCLITDQIRIRYVDPVYGSLTELLIDEASRPEASPPGRRFISSELITLSTATPGAVIYYTTDGTIPVPGVSSIYTDAIRISVTTNIRAIAVKPGFKDSKVMSQTWTKEFTASRLEILDENGNAIPDGFITGAAKALKIKLVTTQDNLGSAQTNATTKVSGDAEAVTLGNSGSLGNAVEFSHLVSLKHPFAKDVGNDTIEATGTDTLIVRWVNPFDPSDVAADTVIIKPAFLAAEVYFSTSENGPRITEYPVGQDSIYVVVKTRPRDPSLAYTVSVTSSDGSGDREVLALTELLPGVFSAKAPVGTGAKAKGDNAVQVAAAGDQLTAIFTDPVYQTDYRGDAGFAQQVQESASLEFIDSAGNAIAPADIWNPAKGKIYLRFSDDWNAGIDLLIQTKDARLTLVNRKSGDSIGADVETATLNLKSHTASRGIWEGFLTLADKNTARNGNDTVEAYFRGELRAAVTPHNNAGLAVSPDAVDNLVIAYPDQPAEIVIRDLKGGNVDRQTDKVEIIIRDQPFTKSGDPTINAEVGCSVSGDKVAKVTLVWDGTAYVIKPPLDKGELATGTADKNDALLLCRDSDILTVIYIDPVYLKPRSADVKWSDDPVAKLHYASTKDTSVITSATDGSVKDFLIVVEGKSVSRDKVDTVFINLATAQGEKETYAAIETGPFTGRYIVKAEFRFASADPVKDDRIVEARITVANRVNQVLVNGTAKVGNDNVAADLSLLSSYDLVVKAYMKDEDENGRADHAYFVFDHKLSKLPSSLDDVYWNQEGADYKKKAETSQLSFKPGSDSSVVVADFGKSQFTANLTDIPVGKPAPYGGFPDDNLFGGQKPSLADSMGPVPVTAVKYPSNLQSYNVTTTIKRFNPDTLVITISERIKASTTFEEMLRFSKGCSDYKESNPIKLFGPPSASADGLTWIVIVDNAPDAQAPLTGDCIFLEADGRYTDLVDNRAAHLGVPLEGKNPKLTIREFRGFPPVAGMDANNIGFLVTTNDARADSKGSWSNYNDSKDKWEVLWIPPFGFKEEDPVGALSVIAKDFNNPRTGERRPEVSGPQRMPPGISAVQIISSGAYKAQIRIFDNLGHFVRSMEQAYGLNGEDKNPDRATDKGQMSFLVWDMEDEMGNEVGQGVFVWKVSFIFLEKNKKSEVMYTRTGVVRGGKKH